MVLGSKQEATKHSMDTSHRIHWLNYKHLATKKQEAIKTKVSAWGDRIQKQFTEESGH